MDSSVTVDDGFDGLRTWLGIGVRPDVRWFLSPPSPLCSPIWGNVASSWQLFIKVKVKVCVCVCVCFRVCAPYSLTVHWRMSVVPAL